MHLEWSVFARADRRTHFDHIEADNPRVAAAIDERIRARLEGLARFPEMGRLGRIEGTRELVVSGTPTLQPIASWAKLCGYCGCCMELSSGRMRCLRNRRSLSPNNLNFYFLAIFHAPDLPREISQPRPEFQRRNGPNRWAYALFGDKWRIYRKEGTGHQHSAFFLESAEI